MRFDFQSAFISEPSSQCNNKVGLYLRIEVLLKDLQVTSVLSFPNANKIKALKVLTSTSLIGE